MLNAIEKGRLAGVKVLRDALRDADRPKPAIEDYAALASKVIDAWLLASNPVGKADSIYDEFYRLREVAQLVLTALDNETDVSGAREALRGVLISLGCDPHGPSPKPGAFVPRAIDVNDELTPDELADGMVFGEGD